MEIVQHCKVDDVLIFLLLSEREKPDSDQQRVASAGQYAY